MRRPGTYTLPFKSLWSVFIEINTFIQQGCIQLIKSDSKDFYIVIKDFDTFQINATLLNFL